MIGQGVPNTRMDGWGRVLDPPEIKAVAAYVYYLAKQAGAGGIAQAVTLEIHVGLDPPFKAGDDW